MAKFKFRPLHDRVVVKRLSAEEKTKGGIIIPDTAKEKPSQGEVIAVGPGGRDESGKIVKPDVKSGDRVLFGKWSGTESSRRRGTADHEGTHHGRASFSDIRRARAPSLPGLTRQSIFFEDDGCLITSGQDTVDAADNYPSIRGQTMAANDVGPPGATACRAASTCLPMRS
jgi:chaperonin GroES